MNEISNSQMIQLTLFAFMLAGGQILFKKAAASIPALNSPEAFAALGLNPWLWMALALYGAATLIWVMILQSVPLSTAYPFVALGFVIVPLASWLLFHETLGWQHAGGTVFILLGLGLITGFSK